MAERKKIENASESTLSDIKNAKPVGNAGGLRVGAILLWVAAIAFELLAVLVAFSVITFTKINPLIPLLAFIVLDLVCLIIGSQLWKKANHIAPASKKNALKFWLWNNMGMIVAVFAFVPLVILLLTNKNLDKQTKTIATIAAVVALLIGGLAGHDWNPISAEEKEAAQAAVSGAVYWTAFGKVYHTHVTDEALGHTLEDNKECPYLNRSDSLTRGTVEEAIAAGKTRLCSYCARHDNINTEGLLMDPNSEGEGD